MTHHDKARELAQRQRQIASLHRGFCASETDTIRGPAIMSFGEHARLAADAAAAADLITALAEENQRLRDALKECEAEIDRYIWQEYPLDHPVHERYRQRDFIANPDRAALSSTGGEGVMAMFVIGSWIMSMCDRRTRQEAE